MNEAIVKGTVLLTILQRGKKRVPGIDCQENRQTVTEEEEERHRFTQRKGKEAELSKKSAGM